MALHRDLFNHQECGPKVKTELGIEGDDEILIIEDTSPTGSPPFFIPKKEPSNGDQLMQGNSSPNRKSMVHCLPEVKNEPAEDYSEVEFVEVSPADEQRPVHLDSKEEPNNVELPRSDSWDVAQEDVTAVLQVEHTFT